MKTIGIYHTKGGVGKSAAVVFLADFLSSLYAKRVLVVDLDPQGSAAGAILGGEALREGFAAGKSLPALMAAALDGMLPAEVVRRHIMERPAQVGRKGTKYIGAASVLASPRAQWTALNDRLHREPAETQRNFYDLLADVLRPLDGEFDICLIDFPGSESGIMAHIGMRAAGWWLLPVKPDWFSVEDLDVPLGAVREAQKHHRHRVRFLGTLLNICPKANSKVYQKAKHSLQRFAEEGGIPPLFAKKSEILHHAAALKALDRDAAQSRTMRERYDSASSPFYTGLRNLAGEVLKRLDEDFKAPNPRLLDDFRRKLADYWR